MLERVLEPEVMDSQQEAIDYDSMGHAEVNRAFVDDLVAAAESISKSKTTGRFEDVLDLGTGTAQIPIELCRRVTSANVIGVDLAITMIELGRKNVQSVGLTDRIKLQAQDAKRLDFADRRFQAVMSNSIVHHIPQPLDVLREMVRVLASGGLIFVRDLMRPDSGRQVEQLVDMYAAGANDHQRRMFNESLRAALTLAEIRSLVTRVGFPADAVVASSDRHWTWQAVGPS